jgi:hypothetical protein
MRYVALVTLSLCFVAPSVWADEQDAEPGADIAPVKTAGPFDQGRLHVSGNVEAQSSLGENTVVAGLGVGYFLVAGLEVGGQVSRSFGADPDITVVSPYARYVFQQLAIPVKPYAGAFYRRQFIDGAMEDVDSAGGAAGVSFAQGAGLVLAAGVVYEHTLRCQEDCGRFYPEFRAGYSFGF